MTAQAALQGLFRGLEELPTSANLSLRGQSLHAVDVFENWLTMTLEGVRKFKPVADTWDVLASEEDQGYES